MSSVNLKQTPIGRLIDDLHRLMENKELADIAFIVGNKEDKVFAHKVILESRCKNFKPCKFEYLRKLKGCSIDFSDIIEIKLPMYDLEIFLKVLKYVYTATIDFEESRIIDILKIAHTLGIEDLHTGCKDAILSTMTVSNACTHLENLIVLPETLLEKSFIHKIISFIGKNATECVKTQSFLDLSQNSLAMLISTDSFELREEEVFRCCLRWAKNKAGVTQEVVDWSEKDKAKICQELTPILQYIRFLLIDSKIFAEEVEPTGCVPIEFILERYRFAALGNQQSDSLTQNLFSKYLQNDKKNSYLPRQSCSYFFESNLLKSEKYQFQHILNNWFGVENQEWKLLYRASCHGFSSKVFHEFCDNVAPLYILITDDKHNIGGGFTDVPFEVRTRSNGYIYSNKAFLFRLFRGESPQRFNVQKQVYALYYDKRFGPIFGGGADLLISSNAIQNSFSYSNLGHSYSANNVSSKHLFDDYNFRILDIEVFTTSK